MSYNLDNFLIGSKLRDFRIQANLKLSQAAAIAGVSPAFISMVENGKSGISIAKIHTLLAIYGKTLSDLSDAPVSNSDFVNVADANLVAVEKGIRIFGLAKDDSRYHISGFYLYFEPGASNQFDYHAGAEFLIVLEGTFELRFHSVEDGGDVYTTRQLSTGDTMVYTSSIGHEYKNISDKVGKLLIVEICGKNQSLSSGE